MLLGALIEAGVPPEILHRAAASLKIGAELGIHSVDRGGIRATKVDVLEHGVPVEGAGDHQHHHDDVHSHRHSHSRNWPQIRSLISGAELPKSAKKTALRAFELLAEAEAKVHGIAPEEVHFHEVGARGHDHGHRVRGGRAGFAGRDAVALLGGERGQRVCELRAWTHAGAGSGDGGTAEGRARVFRGTRDGTDDADRGGDVAGSGVRVRCAGAAGGGRNRVRRGGRNPEGFANVLRLSIGTPVGAAMRVRSFSGDRVVVS